MRNLLEKWDSLISGQSQVLFGEKEAAFKTWPTEIRKGEVVRLSAGFCPPAALFPRHWNFFIYLKVTRAADCGDLVGFIGFWNFVVCCFDLSSNMCNNSNSCLIRITGSRIVPSVSSVLVLNPLLVEQSEGWWINFTSVFAQHDPS